MQLQLGRVCFHITATYLRYMYVIAILSPIGMLSENDSCVSLLAVIIVLNCSFFTASFIAVSEGVLPLPNPPPGSLHVSPQALGVVNVQFPDKSGGCPLPVCSSQAVEVNNQLHDRSGGLPLSVSAPQPLEVVNNQLLDRSGRLPLPVSAAQPLGPSTFNFRTGVADSPSLCLLHIHLRSSTISFLTGVVDSPSRFLLLNHLGRQHSTSEQEWRTPPPCVCSTST